MCLTWKLNPIQASDMHQIVSQRLCFMNINKTGNCGYQPQTVNNKVHDILGFQQFQYP